MAYQVLYPGHFFIGLTPRGVSGLKHFLYYSKDTDLNISVFFIFGYKILAILKKICYNIFRRIRN